MLPLLVVLVNIITVDSQIFGQQYVCLSGFTNEYYHGYGYIQLEWLNGVWERGGNFQFGYPYYNKMGSDLQVYLYYRYSTFWVITRILGGDAGFSDGPTGMSCNDATEYNETNPCQLARCSVYQQLPTDGNDPASSCVDGWFIPPFPSVRSDIQLSYCTPDPTMEPTSDPTIDPTMEPTMQPTNPPSPDTTAPSFDPTQDPTHDPTNYPSLDPTTDPTNDPTSADPTRYPSIPPTSDPTIDPTNNPTIIPSSDPTVDPTNDPSVSPTNNPSIQPTSDPTNFPSNNPSASPSYEPTAEPSRDPSRPDTAFPTHYYPTTYPERYETTDTPETSNKSNGYIAPCFLAIVITLLIMNS